MADTDVMATLVRARDARVDLGSFTAEELWRAGVELRGAAPREDPPPASRLPLGPRSFRQLADPPAARLAVTLADQGSETARALRDATLVEPTVAKVVSTRVVDEPRTLSLQPVAGLVEEVLAEGGVTTPTTAELSTRLFLAFPLRFAWAKGKGLLPSQRLVVVKAPMPRDEAIWMDLEIRTGPGATPVVEEKRSPRAAAALPALEPDAGAGAIADHVQAFFGAFWSVVGPGPRP